MSSCHHHIPTELSTKEKVSILTAFTSSCQHFVIISSYHHIIISSCHHIPSEESGKEKVSILTAFTDRSFLLPFAIICSLFTIQVSPARQWMKKLCLNFPKPRPSLSPRPWPWLKTLSIIITIASGIEWKRHNVLLCDHYLCRVGHGPNYSCLNIPGLLSLHCTVMDGKVTPVVETKDVKFSGPLRYVVFTIYITGDDYHGLLILPLCDVSTQHSTSVHRCPAHQCCRPGHHRPDLPSHL